MSTASTARSRKRGHDGSRQKVDVINLETTAPVVNTGNQREALILRGTRTSPIDVEALDDKPKNVAQTRTARAKVAPKEPTFTCPVCLNKLDKPSTTNCGHIFCEKCIGACLKAQKKCPTCRKSLGIKGFHRVYLPTPADDY
uniref:RING-type domain-containing protein n=1 Tax=Oryza punctata TaxID=4537 RepID=A0A0E0LX44_ORYPU